MSDRYVEKSFLYLLLFSLLLHCGAFVAILYLPSRQAPPPKEPVFVDLRQIPEANISREPAQIEPRRQSDRRRRVARETAPRGQDSRDSSQSSSRPAPHSPPKQATARSSTLAPAPSPTTTPAPGQPAQPGQTAGRELRIAEGSPASALLKPRSRQGRAAGQPRLFPGAGGLARMEENYRRKFEKDIAEGNTKLLNTDDIQFGSFLRRFENSVYNVWRYPEEAARNGVAGITPVRITFNRRGEVAHVELLESSGARILDDEVFRTLKLVGPLGAFPKGYDKDEFHLIAFFQYGLSRRSIR